MTELAIALVTLTFLEIVLGVDNVIFISILSGKLRKEQQKRARRVGLMMAMLMRLALLFSITWMARLTKPLFTFFGDTISGRDLILIGGGLFLLAKATYEIHDKLEGHSGEQNRVAASFRSVIIQVMLLDIVFSLDSVITAIGMSDHLGVMVTAVVLAVLVMLVAAEPISTFVEAHPTVKILALSFLLLIGRLARRRRVRPPHLEGLHLLRDGLLGLRGGDQHPRPKKGRASALAPALRLVTIKIFQHEGHEAHEEDEEHEENWGTPRATGAAGSARTPEKAFSSCSSPASCPSCASC